MPNSVLATRPYRHPRPSLHGSGVNGASAAGVPPRPAAPPFTRGALAGLGLGLAESLMGRFAGRFVGVVRSPGFQITHMEPMRTVLPGGTSALASAPPSARAIFAFSWTHTRLKSNPFH